MTRNKPLGHCMYMSNNTMARALWSLVFFIFAFKFSCVLQMNKVQSVQSLNLVFLLVSKVLSFRI